MTSLVMEIPLFFCAAGYLIDECGMSSSRFSPDTIRPSGMTCEVRVRAKRRRRASFSCWSVQLRCGP